jgi:hypothetical protein
VDASRAFFAEHNSRALASVLQIAAAMAAISCLPLVVTQAWSSLAWPLANLLLVRLFFTLRKGEAWRRKAEPLLLGFLLTQFALVHALHLSLRSTQGIYEELFFLPLLLLPFRWPPRIAVLPLGLLWLAGSGRHLLHVLLAGQPPSYAALGAQALMLFLVYYLIAERLRREQGQFIDTWRQENRKHREQARIRDELDAARKIQLSMLPRREPRLPWAELSSISLPASEVGGDYFDYFELGDGRLAVVVGDVAGHGLASSLLLSGIRSCLHLLQETSMSPLEILQRLDRMVRKTTDDRTFVTLLYALFDPQESKVIFAAAGHPPPLHYREKTAEVTEHSLPALPLGTKLRGPLQEKEVRYQPGDIFALFTDGIVETTNKAEESYGNERLHQHMLKACRRPQAKEIRDSILSDVWKFKGDGKQLDDITVVILKTKPKP